MTIASFFSGAGGLDLGFKKAGFNILWANEYDKTIWETYEKNHKETFLEKKSILEINKNNIPETDGIIGGPPCQSWSIAGSKRGELDPRGKLFFEFIKILELKKPKFFIAENVAGILSKRHEESLNKIIKLLKNIGYELSINLVDAFNYNVPQNRKRVFFIGYRKDLNKKFKFPEKKEKHIYLKDVLFNLPQENNEYLKGGFSSMFMSRNRVRTFEEPSFTIQASGRHCPIHPNAPRMEKVSKDMFIFKEENKDDYRRFTVRECARIQTFPDDFIFYYNRIENGYKMIGNAVPVNLSFEIAKQIKKDLF